MKTILFDFLRRMRWAYAALLVLQLLLIATALKGGRPEHGVRMGLGFVAFSGSLLLAMDLKNGAARALLALPVAVRTIGHAFWLLAVVIPTLLGTTSILAAKVVEVGMNLQADRSLSREALLIGHVLAYTGMSYFLLSLMPAGPQVGFWRNLRGGLAGAGWGGMLGFSMFLMEKVPQEWSHVSFWHGVCLLVGWVLAVLGYFRGEALLLCRAQRPFQARKASSEPARVVCRPHPLAGAPYLWWTVFRESALASASLLVFVAGFLLVLGESRLGGSPSGEANPINSFLHFQLSGMLCLALGTRWLTSLRSFRVLPQSTNSLCLQTFAVPLIPFVVYWTFQVAVTLALNGPLPGDSWLRAAPLALGALSMAGPVLVRLGPNALTLVLVAALSVGAPVMLAGPLSEHLSWPASWTVGGLLALCGYLLCHRTLTSPRGLAYRGLKLGFFQGF